MNQNTQATLDERNEAITNVNREKDQALQNINDAQTNDNVREAESNGNRAIQQVALKVRKK
ncbi:DUF1542 domain-containing protein [Staphylococcus saccharolyticus]|uniref:DUF1542 domain-containing protein n=1 Tax=Staphylococcus saccharolyticus TaxID=33028 RepID=UPI001EF02790|nr:DUF1542 domain-containing protein [Staphylococcus saccharolyticus]